MSYLAAIQNHFKQYGSPTDAKLMEAYMKGKFPFLGIRSPERKRLFNAFNKMYGKPDRDEIEGIIIGLWSLPHREYHYCGMELANKTLTPTLSDDIFIIEYMLEYQQWWDTIDFIASHLVGSHFHTHDGNRNFYFNKWVRSNDIWLNRTTILFQLSYKHQTNTRILEEAITRHKDSSEFFIQKAIGWALRQFSKTNPDWVKDFVARHALKPISLREATKYC